MHRRFVVLVAALGLVAAACSGGDDKKVDATARRTTTTSETDGSELTIGGTSTSVAGSSPTTAKGQTATTRRGSGAGATTPAPTASSNAAPGPAKTGTYDYAQSGTTSQPGEQANKPVPPSGTMVVSGGQSQVFARYFDPGEDPPSDIHFNFTDAGPFITQVVVRYGLFEITCSFGSPVPAPPWPADAGKKFSGHATCSNGFAADFSGSVTGRTTSNVGGTNIEAVIIKSTLHVYDDGGYVDINVNDTQHWAPSLSVPTYSNEVINGNAFGAAISGNITSKLKSVTPR